MANHGFGGGDFEALARQYWNTWGETMRQAASAGQPAPAPSAMPGWSEAAAWWSQLARSGQPTADDAVQRFNTQAQGWFGQMQQLAAQFAGRDASPTDIAGEWRRMLGGHAGNPFAEMFGAMPGRGQHGPEQWLQQAAPYLEMLQRQTGQWLDAPAFGFAREHQERLQQLAKAQVDYQQRSQAYQALMGEAGQAAFGHFERKLAERGAPGRELESGRALFDLWIDAAEEAYAEIALSERFREVYADYVNAQMRLRAAVQKEVEQACGALGIPTRTEIDASHRKVVQLERELRRLRDAARDQDGAGPRGQSRGTTRRGTGRAASDDDGGEAMQTGSDTASRRPKAARKAPPKPARNAARASSRSAPRAAAWQADAPQSPGRSSASKKKSASSASSRAPSRAAVKQVTPGRKAVLGDQAPPKSARATSAATSAGKTEGAGRAASGARKAPVKATRKTPAKRKR